MDENTDSYLSMVPGGHGDATTTSSDTYARDRSRSYLDMTPTPAVPTPIPCSPSDGMVQHRGGGLYMNYICSYELIYSLLTPSTYQGVFVVLHGV